MISNINSAIWLPKRDLLWLLLPLLFLTLVILFMPFRFVFELDTDEGVNLIKAQLVTQGANLYRDIWSDQPPLFTVLLAGWIRAFGLNLTSIRLLILLMTCVLVWAFAHYLRVFWGSAHALAGTLSLILLPQFLFLSVAIMIGLPAIALATLSFVAISFWHRDKKQMWLVLSGIALSLSVMTKLFTGFLAPIFLLGLTAQEAQAAVYSRSIRKLFAPGATWMAAFGLSSLLIGVPLICPDGIPQLLGTLLFGRATDAFQERPETIATYLNISLPTILLGLVGSLHAIQKRKWTSMYLVGWALASYLLLAQHRPVWYHHQLLVTIPLSALSGIAVGEFLVSIARLIRRPRVSDDLGQLNGILAAILSFSLLVSIPHLARQLDIQLPNFKPPEVNPTDIPAWKILELMRRYEGETKMVITDRPMLAARLGLAVPPELAVLTAKRLKTGEITQDDIILAIERYQPEQVALARFDLQIVDAYLYENYHLVYRRTHHRLYVRRDLQGLHDLEGAPDASVGFITQGATCPNAFTVAGRTCESIAEKSSSRLATQLGDPPCGNCRQRS